MSTFEKTAFGRTQVDRLDRALGWVSQPAEVQIEELRVRGVIPNWLSGTMVRDTMALLEIGGRPVEHSFDALALLAAFSFRDGRVSYTSRYVQSEAWKLAQSGEYSGVGIITDPCRSLFKRVSAFLDGTVITDNPNVAVTRLGERYLAMTEQPVPIEFDPETLATIGPLSGVRRFGEIHGLAHPHTDVHGDGSMINYVAHLSLSRGFRNEYRLFSLDPRDAKRTEIASVPASRTPSYLHSFGMSENYLVIVEQPLLYSPLGLGVRGGALLDAFRWKPELGTTLTVVDRQTGKVHSRHQTEAFFVFHHVNAVERDGELCVDLVRMEDARCWWNLKTDDLVRNGKVPPTVHGLLYRYHLSLTGGPVRGEALSDLRMELPRINYGKVNTRPYRYVYGAAISGPAVDWYDLLVRVDIEDGSHHRWTEEGCYPSEPVFVEAPDALAEDDGVVLSVVLDSRAERSFLLVLDAHDMHEIGRAEVPHHLPWGYHGDYFSAPARARRR